MLCGRLLALLALLAAGCAASGPNPGAAPDGPALYVAGHGMHTGLIVRTADLPPLAWPAQRDFPRAEYLELGWGDREYYQAEDFSLWLGLRALLWSTESAVHVVGFSGPAERAFPGSEIVPLRVSPEGFERMVAFIAGTFQDDGIRLGPGQREGSVFYASDRRFHLFETCNTWVARALREGGLNVSPRRAITAEGLLSQLR
jgi:uncharacterized protein (TIGR02117 family)